MNETRERTSSRWWIWIALLVLFYVGSASPVLAFCAKYGFGSSVSPPTLSGSVVYYPPPAIGYFYTPATWLWEIPPLVKPLEAYEQWWFRVMM